MALTAAQIVDIRRFMGYAVAGNSDYYGVRQPVYQNTAPWISLELDTRLANLTASEEVVVSTKLGQLIQLELDLYGASGVRDNIDTAKAAVWERNSNELAERTALFTQLRRDLCSFLGFAPGAGLGAGGSLRVIRG